MLMLFSAFSELTPFDDHLIDASKPNINSSSSKETSCVRNTEGRHLVSWKNDEVILFYDLYCRFFSIFFLLTKGTQSNQVTYEGNENTTQDLDCLLIYDEEKKVGQEYG
jgi:hypothetical protein